MKINDTIVFLRERSDMTQRELAKAIGMSTSVMNRVESGERLLRDDEILKIAKYFNVSVDYLLGNVMYDRSPSMYPFEESKRGKDSDSSYYSDPEIDEAVNAMHKDPELKILFNATKDLKKEDLEFVKNLVKKMKN